MKPGDYVLDLLNNAPKDKRTIVLLRHSARNPFDGMPEHLREGVEITPEGIRLARAFGESLGEIFSGNHLFLGHTVARRCKMTAEAIADAYSPADRVRILGCQPQVDSPVVNPDNYVALRSELGWHEGIRRWLSEEISGDTMRNPRTYSDEILHNLVSFPQAGERDLLIVVAHDITLFPIVFSLFGKNVTAIEFLNGIVVTAGTTTATIRYNDANFSLETERDLL